jgi:hypothetical protein
MANESVVYSSELINPVPGKNDDVTRVVTGGTLTSSNVVELKLLKTAFTGAEGKTRALLAIDAIKAAVVESTWPYPAP